MVLVAAGGGYGGKPRPAVIVQADSYRASASLTVCLLTTRAIETAPTLRLAVDPDNDNRLAKPSWIMVDKITTVPKTKISQQIGRLADRTIEQLDYCLLLFLGLTGRRAG